jgi:Xaa-Pro aminopeptidase
MVPNVEVPYYEIGLGGMQIEDTLLATNADPIVLSRMSRALRLL